MFARSSLLAFCLATASALAAELSVKVTGPTVVTSVDDFTIKTVITNNGFEDVSLLNDPNSILTPKWKTNAFGIIGPKGTPAKFGGVKLIWNPASAIENGHVTTIASGKSIELTHDVSGVYNLTESGVGVYTIDALTDFTAVFNNGTANKVVASIQPHIVHISGQLASFKPAGHQPMATRNKMMNKRDIAYEGCSPYGQSQISIAASSAQTYITDAISYLNAHTENTPRFRTWFGEYTSSHHSTVLSHFSNLSGDPDNVTYDCAICKIHDVYGYVNSDELTRIYLCKAFFQASPTGPYSRAGIIIALLTHFQYYANGHLAAQALASSVSDEAVMSAANYEYFAENNPPLS